MSGVGAVCGRSQAEGRGPLGASLGRSLAASAREAGVGCPHCAVDVALGDPVVVCQACGTVHHEACWSARGGCGSYCLRPREAARSRGEPCRAGVADHRGGPRPSRPARRRRAATPRRDRRGRPRRPDPIPRRRRGRPGLEPGQDQPAGDRLPDLRHRRDPPVRADHRPGRRAAGRPGPGRHPRRRRRGIWLAIPGLLLGVVDVAGWAFILSVLPWHALAPDTIFSDPPPDLASIQELDPPLQRAMRANVLIERAAWAGACSAARRSARG